MTQLNSDLLVCPPVLVEVTGPGESGAADDAAEEGVAVLCPPMLPYRFTISEGLSTPLQRAGVEPQAEVDCGDVLLQA